MAFKQPRIPEYREAEGANTYLRSLVLFLKDFCMECYAAVRALEHREIGGPSASVRVGEQTYAPDEGGVIDLSDMTAPDAQRLGGRTLPELMLALYPVGSIYISALSTSPQDLFGGTWEPICGRFLLGAGANEANSSTAYGSLSAGAINRSAGERGGEVKHTLKTSELPAHKPAIREAYSTGTATGYRFSATNGPYEMANAYFNTIGGGESHNNMPPYLAVYIWKRTA